MSRNRRLAVATISCVLAAYMTRGTWLGTLGRTLVCAAGPRSAEAIVLDNFDNEYGIFRRSAELQRASPASRVLVPTTSSDEEDAAAVAREVTSAFARLAGLTRWELIPIEEREPISLNAAYGVRGFLLTEHITSVILVSPAFRSRRTELIYRSVLRGTDITLGCLPVAGGATPETWTHTWHGLQEVGLQLLKLQYYRFWVLSRV